MSQNGKGSDQRPTDMPAYRRNYGNIKWPNRQKKEKGNK